MSYDKYDFYAPAMTMAGALKVLPLSVHPYICPYVRYSQRRPLSKSNSFDQNFMNIGQIF